MAPLGGAFVAVMGVFVLLGSAIPKLRLTFVYIGFGAATLALILSGPLAAGLPAPTRWQVGWLVVAIIVEFVAFATLMPRMRVRGQQAVLLHASYRGRTFLDHAARIRAADCTCSDAV